MISHNTQTNYQKIILYVTSTRADYGLMRDVLKTLDKDPSLNLHILVCGMHMSASYGNSIEDIRNDGFNIVNGIDTLINPGTSSGMAQSIGLTICKLSEVFQNMRPDVILLEGDRGEALAAAIVGSHMNIPIAHVSGGDVTGGMIDESIRHSITKFAHLHFPGTDLSASRILSMGEQPSKVHMVGTPGANVNRESHLTREEISDKLNLNLSEKLLLVIQHPVTNQIAESATQMKNTMEAIRELTMETVIIKPNSDAGSTEMSRIIDEYSGLSFIHIFENLPRDLFIGVLCMTDVIIGNSSCGITEAPGFGVPAINIGTRQEGREKGNNVVDIHSDTQTIIITVKQLLTLQNDPIHRKNWFISPYLDTNASSQICTILKELHIGPDLLNKQFNDRTLQIIKTSQSGHGNK